MEWLKRVDRAVYRFERFIVAGSMITMSAVVFADVVHRTAADPESRPANWLASLLSTLGAGEAQTLYPTLRDWVMPPLLFLGFVGLCYVGLRWRAGVKQPRRLNAIGGALGLTTAAALGLRLMVWVLPNGVVWAQTLALVLTLWAGFTGASMCTYEGRHLRVQAADKLWPLHLRDKVQAVANFVTAAIVFCLAWLSLIFVGDSYAEYVQTGFHGGVFEGMPILPKWVAFLILPLSFSVMTARFLAVAVSAWRGGRYGRGGADPMQALLDEAGVSGAVAPEDAVAAGEHES